MRTALFIFALIFLVLLSACSKNMLEEETDPLPIGKHEHSADNALEPYFSTEVDSLPAADLEPNEFGTPEQPDAADAGWQARPWRDSYADLLKTYAHSDSMSFLLHDFDGDGIPELLIGGYYEDEVVDAVYTYTESGMLQLEYEEGLFIASFALISRTHIRTGSADEPGFIMYLIGPTSGVLGTNITYRRIGIEGNKLFIAAHGMRYVDVDTLIELVGGLHGEGVNDSDELYATIKEHTYWYIDDKEVTEEEFYSIIESGDHLYLSRISMDSVRELLMESLENPRLVESSRFHALYCDENFLYLNILFDNNGNTVSAEKYFRLPHIDGLDNNRLSVSIQAGTGIATRWTYYYDVERNEFSDVFYAVFQQYEDIIVYAYNRTVIVRDIFNETKYHKVFNEFQGISTSTAFPFVDACFIDDGRSIIVTYYSESYDEISVTLDLML